MTSIRKPLEIEREMFRESFKHMQRNMLAFIQKSFRNLKDIIFIANPSAILRKILRNLKESCRELMRNLMDSPLKSQGKSC